MLKKALTFYFLALCYFATGQVYQVAGIIQDAQNQQPIVGATIIIKDGPATITDVDGKFSLQAPSKSSLVEISYIGYEKLEIPAVDLPKVINLMTSSTLIDEIVVVGYGSQIKSTLTGNIVKLAGNEVANRPVASLEQSLQGKAAGVFVESSNGKPGGGIKVKIRGSSSLTASNQPLYVVDGIIITVESLNESGASLNPLADLNPNDIASIEVLKDASASAIYGARASNGVVLITTKAGQVGKTKFDVNLQSGVSSPTRKRSFLNADQYIKLMTRSVTGAAKYEYAGDPTAWTDEQEAIDWYLANYAAKRFARYSGWSDYTKLETNTDWQDQAFADNPISTLASISASGGNDKTKFYVGTSYNKQQGILVNNGFSRMGIRLNLDQKANDKLSFGAKMSLSRTFTDQVSNDNAFSTPMQLVALSPLTPVRDKEGNLYDRPTTTYYNGLIDVENAKRDVLSFRTLVNSYAKYNILRNLVLNGEFGLDIYNLRDNAYYGRKTDTGQSTNGFANATYAQVVNILPKLFLNYNKSFNLHAFDLTLGTEYQKSRRDRTTIDGTNFPSDDLKTLESAATITRGKGAITEFSFLSYFARVNYNFDRKYLLSVSSRVDGSSRFGSNKRFGLFPSVSAGWVISEEDFLQDNQTMSFLKLRASYGRTGNAEIGNFSHLGLYGSSPYGGQPGLAPTQISNPNLGWEKTDQIDFGLDFGLFDNKLTGEIDWYQKNTKDLLLDVPVPGTSGFSTQTVNIGRIQNKGVEFSLTSNTLNGDLKWSTSFNIAFNKNKVIELGNGQDIIDENLTSVVKVGEAIGVFWGAEWAGVDPANGDALWYINAEGSKRQTTNDYSEANFVKIGDPNPDFIGGISNSFSYQGISLDFSFQGVFGNELYLDGDRFMACQGCWYDNQTTDQLNHWDKPGDITDVPEPRFWYSNGEQARNGRYISDGSYLRLKSLILGYELPKSVLRTLNLDRLKVYLTGQNLLTFTKYKGWDPEVTSDTYTTKYVSGIDFYSAPQPKTVAIGVQVGF
jgi:TonB-linked SusC/RagA family outer membrane protein